MTTPTTQPTLHDLYERGILTTSDVLRAALILAGFNKDAATDLVATLTPSTTPTTTTPRVYARWTQREHDLLTSLYEQGVPVDTIAQRMHRKPTQVLGMVSRLGLHRSAS